MNAEYFNPDTDLRWYCDSSRPHVGDKERELKARWKLKVEILRKRKKAIQITSALPKNTDQ